MGRGSQALPSTGTPRWPAREGAMGPRCRGPPAARDSSGRVSDRKAGSDPEASGKERAAPASGSTCMGVPGLPPRLGGARLNGACWAQLEAPR